jgi:hypothetical protein
VPMAYDVYTGVLCSISCWRLLVFLLGIASVHAVLFMILGVGMVWETHLWWAGHFLAFERTVRYHWQ